jgi:uncharacterized protein
MFLKSAVLLASVMLVCSGQVFRHEYQTVTVNPTRAGAPNRSECCDDSTITVSGSGTIQAKPDQAVISAQLAVNANTVTLATDGLSKQVQSIISILTANGLGKNDYETTSFSVYPNTSWVNGTSTVLGQIASQSFRITVREISSNGSNIGKLFDTLAGINGIVLNGLTFEVKNQTKALELAREAAFLDAKTKAKDYAFALNLNLVKVLSVSENQATAPVVTPSPMMMTVRAANPVATTVNVGTIPISSEVEVVYAFS